MGIPESKEQRDANLDALAAAATGTTGAPGWFAKERQRIQRENQFLRAIKAARGVNNAAARNLDQASQSLQAELNAYLFTE